MYQKQKKIIVIILSVLSVGVTLKSKAALQDSLTNLTKSLKNLSEGLQSPQGKVEEAATYYKVYLQLGENDFNKYVKNIASKEGSLFTSSFLNIPVEVANIKGMLSTTDKTRLQTKPPFILGAGLYVAQDTNLLFTFLPIATNNPKIVPYGPNIGSFFLQKYATQEKAEEAANKWNKQYQVELQQKSLETNLSVSQHYDNKSTLRNIKTFPNGTHKFFVVPGNIKDDSESLESKRKELVSASQDTIYTIAQAETFGTPKFIAQTVEQVEQEAENDINNISVDLYNQDDRAKTPQEKHVFNRYNFLKKAIKKVEEGLPAINAFEVNNMDTEWHSLKDAVLKLSPTPYKKLMRELSLKLATRLENLKLKLEMNVQLSDVSDSINIFLKNKPVVKADKDYLTPFGGEYNKGPEPIKNKPAVGGKTKTVQLTEKEEKLFSNKKFTSKNESASFKNAYIEFREEIESKEEGKKLLSKGEFATMRKQVQGLIIVARTLNLDTLLKPLLEDLNTRIDTLEQQQPKQYNMDSFGF